MRSKTKILIAILLIFSTLSLSSCYLAELGLELPNIQSGSSVQNGGGDTYIDVEGGDNFEITINTNGNSDIMAAAKSLLSSVSIISSFETDVMSFGRPTGQTKQYLSAGSGVIYKLDKNAGDAYIITNYHVVYDKDANTENKISNDIHLYLYGQHHDKYKIKAEYVGGSMNYDLAVLKVSQSEVLMRSEAKAVDVANSDLVSVLETAIAIGNPEGNGISATVGYVNVESEYIKMLGVDNQTQVEYRVMRIDTAVNSGNSGGGLFNSKGELIGIVNAKMSASAVDNIGYAIPSNVVRAVAENIIYYCDGTDKECVYKCVLGITLSASSSVAKYDTETGKVHIVEEITIKELSESSPSLEVGDIITSVTIDGVKTEVTRLHNVIDAMLSAKVGSTVTLTISRNGEAKEITIPITSAMLKAYK
jgi:serine protease Do